MMDASETRSLGHCLNQDKPINFFSKETLAKFTSRVSKEEHQTALLRIKELERMIETEEDKRIARMEKSVDRIISNIKHNLDMYFINNLFDEYETAYEVEELVNDLLRRDFSKRMEAIKQLKLL